ncbi:hypothetical protein B5K08_05560 [Rhizobium leguminosarum bv. trifolii]|uniref:Uncharacterized protein n=1 Tax=Rhizobium leguminosarum bv. trifolii TaxID=386 RepID=A0A3E1BXY4_RHILT|nr:hypothetical protein [Rhizobium leguminosarum]RFB98017.1 hypothetical protein B5K08_05560 [Rhizobium leguminosarum bv. trifolii]RFB99970.1 hypothetical protein B5K10_05550 [Rhizobium leguminosarum bv. trifolii]
MNLVRLLETQSAALEAYLPSVNDEDARMEALGYLRGIQTVLASRPASSRSSVIDLEDRRLEHRIRAATFSYRKRQVDTANRQLAAAARYVQQISVDEFGRDNQDGID